MLKLPAPDKVRRVFPDRLGSLVAGFNEKGDEIEASKFELESGEELEPIQPGELGFHRENDDEKERKIRQRTSKDSVTPVTVLKSISEEDKRSDLDYELSQREINLEKLQRIASTGIPDGGALRATAWKLLLGYLDSSHDLWDKQLKENRQKYANLKEDLLRNPVINYCWFVHFQVSRYIYIWCHLCCRLMMLLNLRQSAHIWKEYEELSSTKRHEDTDVDGPLRRHEISHEDHPLSLGKASIWSQYFQYTEIGEQIDRDLQRTHPDLPFFSGESSISCKNREAMKNILLLFAKLNPEIRYVQGMNEVLAPIYYVFSTDPDKQNAANVEADSFSCFVRILGDSVDHFCQQLDNSSSGILATLSRLSDLLKVNDEQLWRHLELRTKVKPQFYAFRWITLLLTQEFKFESILRIWDTLLSNPFGVQDMLLRICCAMLVCVKSKLLSGDFVANLKLLQHYPDDINVEFLLQREKKTPPRSVSTCVLSFFLVSFFVVIGITAMCSMISAQGVAVATAMAVSGTVILLALRLQNQKSFPPPEFSVHEIPPSPHPVLRSCISSVGKKKMKKKRVHFAKDVVESCKDGEEFRKRNSRSKVHYEEDEEEAKIGRVNVMPANRAALYNGILRDRVAQRLAYSC